MEDKKKPQIVNLFKRKKPTQAYTRQGLIDLDQSKHTKLQQVATNIKQITRGQAKVFLYSSLLIGLIYTSAQPFITRAESPGGTKTKDTTQVAKDIYVTNVLNQTVASLTKDEEPIEVTTSDYKVIEEEQEVQELPEQQELEEVPQTQPQTEILEVQVHKQQQEETNKVIVTQVVEEKQLELGVIALKPKEEVEKPTETPAEAKQPAAPEAKPGTEEETSTTPETEPTTPETEPTTPETEQGTPETKPEEVETPQPDTPITVLTEEPGLLYLKNQEPVVYKETTHLTQNDLPLGLVLETFKLSPDVSNEYIHTTKRIQVGDQELYHFNTQTGVRGYIAAEDVDFKPLATITEENSIKDRDYIEFDTEGTVVTDANPFSNTQTTKYTIKNGTKVHVDSTQTVHLQSKLERFIEVKTAEGKTAYIPEADINVTDSKLTANKDNVVGYTEINKKTKVDLQVSDLTYIGTQTHQTGKGVLTYYKFQLPEYDVPLYVSSEDATKKHYGFASNTEKDERIYKVNISTMLYDQPKTYKNAKVTDKIAIGKYVKAKNKLKVTNTDDTTTDWVEIYDNGKKLGYIEASKLEEMAKELEVTATATDTFETLAKTYQLDTEQLKGYNPELSLFGEVTKDATVYLHAREGLEALNKKYTSLDSLFKVLELEDTAVKKEMIEAQDKENPTKSNLVSKLGYMVPYIKHRGFLPSVTFGQAVHESGDGTSGLSTRDLNLFGIKGSYKGSGSNWATGEVYSGNSVTINATFRSYPTLEESLKDYLDLLENNYNVKGINDPTQALTAVQAGGYATDPSYVSKNMSTINTYNLTVLDD